MHNFCNLQWLPQLNIPRHITLFYYLPLSHPKHSEGLGYFLCLQIIFTSLHLEPSLMKYQV